MASPVKAASRSMPLPEQHQQQDDKPGLWEVLNDLARPLDGLVDLCARRGAPLPLSPATPSPAFSRNSIPGVFRTRRPPAPAHGAGSACLSNAAGSSARRYTTPRRRARPRGRLITLLERRSGSRPCSALCIVLLKSLHALRAGGREATFATASAQAPAAAKAPSQPAALSRASSSPALHHAFLPPSGHTHTPIRTTSLPPRVLPPCPPAYPLIRVSAYPQREHHDVEMEETRRAVRRSGPRQRKIPRTAVRAPCVRCTCVRCALRLRCACVAVLAPCGERPSVFPLSPSLSLSLSPPAAPALSPAHLSLSLDKTTHFLSPPPKNHHTIIKQSRSSTWSATCSFRRRTPPSSCGWSRCEHNPHISVPFIVTLYSEPL